MQPNVDHIVRKKFLSARKRELVRSIARNAFWSYPGVAPSKVPDSKLIEKVLIYGDNRERKELLNIFPVEKVRRIWEQNLIIQEPRLRDLNRRLAPPVKRRSLTFTNGLFHLLLPTEFLSKKLSASLNQNQKGKD